MILELPVRSDLPAYDFKIELEGTVYTFAFHFNERMNRWIMDISTSDEVPLILGIPLLYNADLIGRFVMVGRPKGRLLAYDESGKEQNAERYTFGQPILLLYEESTDNNI